MPGLERLTQLQCNTADGVIAHLGKTELQMRGEPFSPHRITGGVEVDDDIGKILLDKVRQQEAIVQLRAPAREFWRCIGLAPEPRHQRPQQQLLRQAHAGMGRHLERT
ncbi:hypothetical protein D3C85_1017960 [compost metagenome]